MKPPITEIDRLQEKPCWLIDTFPATVPQKADGRYFEVEEYLQAHRRRLNDSFCRLLLKLYCYYDFTVINDREALVNPPPAQLAEEITRCFAGEWKARGYLNILVPECDAMVILNGDDLYMILHSAHKGLEKLVSQLAAGEGLFFYPAPAY